MSSKMSPRANQQVPRINVNGLHFKDDFKVNNFDEVSTDLFPNTAGTLATALQNWNPNTPVTINDIVDLIAAVSPGTVAAQQTSFFLAEIKYSKQATPSIQLRYLLKYNSSNLKKANNMTLTLQNKRGAHSTLQFPVSLSILLETPWERCSISWMVLIKWSPDQAISFVLLEVRWKETKHVHLQVSKIHLENSWFPRNTNSI